MISIIRINDIHNSPQKDSVIAKNILAREKKIRLFAIYKQGKKKKKKKDKMCMLNVISKLYGIFHLFAVCMTTSSFYVVVARRFNLDSCHGYTSRGGNSVKMVLTHLNII